jgi:hypothetical protein
MPTSGIAISVRAWGCGIHVAGKVP